MRALHLLPLLLAACGGGSEEPAQEGPRPNVLLVTLDTLRADHLGCYGYLRDTSPRLDALAAEGVRFERCLAPMATTLPSHTTMLTGVPPIEHGVLANLGGRFVFEREASLVTLAEVFSGAGYATGAFVSAFPLRSGAGLNDGFDVYDAPKLGQRRGGATVRLALDWLAPREDEPWFMWVHLFDPHTPYDPPLPHRGAFAWEGRMDQVLVERGIQGEQRVRSDLDLYDAEVQFTDALLGRLLDAVGDELIVVVTADHGEGLHQHGITGHGYVWGEQLRVPLVIRAPGLEPRIEAGLCSLLDLAPTILSLAQPSGAGALRDQLRGVDLLAPSFEGRALMAQSTARKRKDDGVTELAWITERWKLVQRGANRRNLDDVELYDLSADPHEQADVAQQHPQVVAELTAALEAELSSQRSRRGGKTREGTSEEIEQLQGMGYGGGNEEEDD